MAAMVLVLVLTAGACGNEGGSGGGNGGGSGETSKGEPTQAQAQAALLATADFPSGWQGGPSTGDGGDDDSGDDEVCDEIDTTDEVEPSAEADAKFAAAKTGPFVLHAVALYRDEDEARKVVNLLAEAFEKCKEFTETEEEIGELQGTFTKISPQDLGDEALGATITAEGTRLSVAGDLVVVRKGRGIS